MFFNGEITIDLKLIQVVKDGLIERGLLMNKWSLLKIMFQIIIIELEIQILVHGLYIVVKIKTYGDDDLLIMLMK